MKSHHKAGGRNNPTWLTPQHFIEGLGPFDLDPCAAPSPRPWPTAKRMIELPECGLEATWRGMVWLNPPYGRETDVWMEKMAAHGRGIALVFVRSDTAWFQAHVLPKASAMLLLDRRVHFCYPDGEPAKHNCGAPMCLVAYGHHAAIRLPPFRSVFGGFLIRQEKGQLALAL